MLYKRIWEGDKLWSYRGKEYIDHQLVLSAAKGNYDQVERLVKVLRDAPKHFKMPNESNTTSSGTSARSEEGPTAPTADGKMIGSVMFGEGDEKDLEFKTAYAALHAACYCGRKEIVEQLLDGDLCNVDADGTDRINGWTVLQVAALSGHKEIVQLLLDKGADIDAPGAADDGATALQAAAGGGHTAVVELLLDEGANSTREEDISDFRGRTALQAAAEGGHVKVVEMLLDHGAAIGDPEPVAEWDGRTTFQAAAGAGHTGIVELLLRDPTDTDNVRNIKGDILNAPGGGNGGRTALQAAAEGGHLAMVELLLKKGANINEAASERNGRTALQAAAGAGLRKMVELLLEKGANVNDACADDGGRSALQAAAEAGNEGMVKLLLERGAKNGVGENISTWYGRTALQAAAEAGHENVVKMLLDYGAKVNAPAAEYVGTMALEAALRKGYGNIAVLLIKKGADVNASKANGASVNALKAAADAKHLKLMTVLLRTGAMVHGQDDNDKRNLIHHAVLGKYVDDGNDLMPDLVRQSTQPPLNAMDTSGSTPLHLAVKRCHLAAIEALLGRVPDLNTEIQDNFGNTPLQRALQPEQTEQTEQDDTRIVRLLLSKGASTDRIPITEFEKLMQYPLTYGEESNDCIIVSDCPSDGRKIEAASWSGPSVKEPRDTTHLLTDLKRIMVFQKPSSSVQAVPSRTGSEDAVPSRIYLAPTKYYKHLEPDSSKSAVQWLTSSWSNSEDDPKRFRPGVPDNEQMLRLRSSSVMLVGYVCFGWPSGKNLETSSATAPAPLKGKSEDQQVRSFNPGAQKVEISWIMRKESKSIEGEYMKGISYRASFPLKTFGLPVHGIEFVTWFLCEVNDRWEKLICDAGSHQARRRMHQLREAGKNQNTIRSLLEDSHEWTRLHVIWQEHLKKAKYLVETFKDCKALEGGPTDNNPRKMTVEKPLDALERELKTLEDRGNALSKIDKDNKELIQLEFNLVSIHEARSSLKMAKASNEMARSMKRLSWITFIFLPLMFIAGLFGMNVDVLSDNPPWQWYLVVSGPFSVLVIITSILCRSLSIKELAEKKDDICKALKSKFVSNISGPSDAGNAQDDTQGGNEMDKSTPVYMIWRRKRAKPENDPESITYSVGEKGV